MLGLFGTLNLGTRSLQTQQQGVEVAGQNLANASNPAYARQRLAIQTSLAIPTAIGPQGTGVNAVAINQIRDGLLDQQITSETSVTGYLESMQNALQYAQSGIGEQLSGNLSADGASSGLGSDLAGLFNGFQAVSAAPESLASRQAVIAQAQELAAHFNHLDQRLSALNDQLNQKVQTDVTSANELLSDIAGLNKQIADAEAAGGAANDLRDLRQQKLEGLAKLVNFQSATTPDGALNLSVDGQLLISGSSQMDSLEAYDPGSGQLLVRTATGGTALTLEGGSLAGTITTRDGALSDLRTGLDSLALDLIERVNGIYIPGCDLHGHTGNVFFTGDSAGNIGVQADLLNDPSLLQASSQSGYTGDNQIALALAQLAHLTRAGNALPFSDAYNQMITGVGSSLASVNNQLDDQHTVQTMLQNQRSSVSGVSIDEEMTDMLKYQRAFQASAHLISTVDQMLDEVVNLKR